MGSPALLTTNRFQEITALGAGRSRYETWDEFSGWLVPLVFALHGENLQRAFAAMVEALRARCESLASSGE